MRAPVCVCVYRLWLFFVCDCLHPFFSLLSISTFACLPASLPACLHATIPGRFAFVMFSVFWKFIITGSKSLSHTRTHIVVRLKISINPFYSVCRCWTQMKRKIAYNSFSAETLTIYYWIHSLIQQCDRFLERAALCCSFRICFHRVFQSLIAAPRLPFMHAANRTASSI